MEQRNKHGIRILKPHHSGNGIPIDDDKRRAVYKKTGGRCAYCGRQLQIRNYKANNYMTIDHAQAKVNGGNDALENLIPSCKKCNNLKSDMAVHEFLCLLRRIENER